METNLTQTAKMIRIWGWVLSFLGVLLCIAMAGLSFYLWRTIQYPGQSGGTAHWTGSAAMTTRTFQLFGTVFVFGLVSLVGGIVQARSGRRNGIFLVLMLLLVGVMFFLGKQIVQMAH
jgi:hypothetical protein